MSHSKLSIESFREKKNEIRKLCSGAVLMAGASRILKFIKTNLLRAEGGKI